MHPQKSLSRREFIIGAALTPIIAGLSCSSHGVRIKQSARPQRLFFVSQGKTAIMNADGTGLRYIEFDVPNQATWQPTGFFADGQRVLFLSMEPRRDGPGRPFDEYYTQTHTHIWVHNLDTGGLEEVATKDRMAVFTTPQLLLNDKRMLVQVVRNKVGQIFSINLDGTDAREFTRAQDGFPYGMSLSPDGQRVAYHIAGGSGYEIWVSGIDGSARSRVAARAGHIYFGPMWSPDGQWLAYQDCEPASDPGHDWSDIWIQRPDGSDQRQLTQRRSMWFGATYGNNQTRGGGSNMVAWTKDGRILFPRRLPDSKVAWEYQAGRPDTDHFNRDFKPELARGGTEICRLNPRDGAIERLTESKPSMWDFRASASPDGRYIVFCRAATGSAPAIWVMDSDGSNPRELTKGRNDQGADHPRWLP